MQSIDEVWSLKLFGDSGELGQILGTEEVLRTVITEWEAKRHTDELIVVEGFTDTADRARHEVTLSASIIRVLSIVRMY